MQCSQLLLSRAVQGTQQVVYRTAALLLPVLQQHLRHHSCASTTPASSAPRSLGVQACGAASFVALGCSLRSLPTLQHSWGRQLSTAGAEVGAAPPADGVDGQMQQQHHHHHHTQQQQQLQKAGQQADAQGEPAAAAASAAAAAQQQVLTPDAHPLAGLYPRYCLRSATAALSALSLPSLTSLTLQCPPNTDTLATACLTAAAARARGGPPGLLLLQGPHQLPAAQRHLQQLLPGAKVAVVPGCVLLDDIDLVLVDLGLLQRAPSLLYPVIRFVREHPALVFHVRGSLPDSAPDTAVAAAAAGGGSGRPAHRAPPARSSLKQQDPAAQEAARRQHAAALSAALRPSMQRRALLLSNEGWQPLAADQSRDTLAGWAWEAAAGTCGDDRGSSSNRSSSNDSSSNDAQHSNTGSSVRAGSSRAQPPGSHGTLPLARLLPVADLTQQQQAASAATGGGPPPGQLLLCYPVVEALAEGLITPVSQMLLQHTGVDAGALAAAAAAAAGGSTSEVTHPVAPSGQPVPPPTSSTSAAEAALSALVNTRQRNQLLVQAYTAHGGLSKALAYAVDGSHARQLTVAFSLAGVRCCMVHEGQAPEEQEQVWSAFWPGWDHVLVTSRTPPPAQLSAAAAAGGLGMVLMAAPTWSQQQYLARLAPALLPVGAAGSTSGCVVVDCVDGGVTPRTEGEVGGSLGGGDTPAGVGTAGSPGPPLTVADVLPAVGITSSAWLDGLQQRQQQGQVMKDGSKQEADPGAPQPSGVSSSSPPQDAVPAAGGPAGATISGTLLWSVTPDGSWAMMMLEPAASARRRLVGLHTSAIGHGAAGSSANHNQYSRRPVTPQEAVVLDAVAALPQPRVVWLRRTPKGKYVVEVQGASGGLVAVRPGARGLSLQRARDLAEAWLRRHFPTTAEARDLSAEWRTRTGLTPRQISYFQRVGLAYDPQWNRGYAAQVQEAHMLQELQHPTTDLQKHLLSHLLPYVPGPLTTEMRSKEAATFSASASRLLGAAVNGGAGSKPLPARQALLADLVAVWEAGLKLRHPWIVLPDGRLVLDLVNGSYLWLTPAPPPADSPAAAAAARKAAAAAAAAGVQPEGVEGGADEEGVSPEVDEAAAPQLDVSSGRPQQPGDMRPSSSPPPPTPAAEEGLAPLLGPHTPVRLDPAALYHIQLETPDGLFHTLSWGSGGMGRGGLEELFQLEAAAGQVAAAGDHGAAAAEQLGGQTGEDSGSHQGEEDQQPAAAEEVAAVAPPAARASRRRPRRDALAAVPLPLSEAAARAEGYVARWSRVTGLGRGAPLRLVSMTGGWALTGRHLDVAALPPATASQLKALQALGLPTQRRYSVLDADRELTRSNKSAGRPDPPATKAQLERLKELALLQSGEPGGARLTYAQARYLLYRAALAAEAATSGGGKGRGGSRPGGGRSVMRRG